MTEDKAPQPTVEFAGTRYPAILPQDFTLDEQIVLTNWTGMGADALADFPGNHPGLLAALIEVSVARVETRMPKSRLRSMIGKLTAAELENMLHDFPTGEVEGETPPAAPNDSTENGESPSSSGATSSSIGGASLAVIGGSDSGSGGSDASSGSPLATSETGTVRAAG